MAVLSNVQLPSANPLGAFVGAGGAHAKSSYLFSLLLLFVVIIVVDAQKLADVSPGKECCLNRCDLQSSSPHFFSTAFVLEKANS